MKKLLIILLSSGFMAIACTDKNHNGDPDYRDNRENNDAGKGADDDFNRTTPGSSAGTITDANDAGRTDGHHPTEGAAITATPSNEVDSIQTLPK